jgi:hypothetical protein
MNNSIDNLTKPTITVQEHELDDSGFTNSGKTKFKETIQDFCNQIFDKSVRYGDAEKGDGLGREITHDHVTAASYNTNKTFGKKSKNNWTIAGQVGEYIFTGLAGIGGGNLKEQWGTITFGICLGLAVILIVVRLTNTSKD